MITWLIEQFAKNLFSNTFSDVKRVIGGTQYRNQIYDIVHQTFNKHEAVFLPLCMDKEFAELFFRISKGKTVKPRELIELGVKIAERKNITDLDRTLITTTVQNVSTELLHFFEDIDPKEVPGCINRFYNHCCMLEMTQETSITRPASTLEGDNKYFASPYDILNALTAWKTIHHSSQRLIHSLADPIRLLKKHQYGPCKIDVMEEVLEKWLESCVPKLRPLKMEWRFQNDSILRTFFSTISGTQVDNITNKLTDLIIVEFFELSEVYSINLKIIEIHGALWNVLSRADDNILQLINKLEIQLKV